MDAVKERLHLEHNQRAWMAWHVAALMRMQRLPKLERMLAGRQTNRQSWQEQMVIMGKWASVMRKIESHK